MIEIELNNIQLNGYQTQQIAFEHLCKDFLELKYNITLGNGFVLGDKNYGFIESPIVSSKNQHIGFQSKFSDDTKLLRESFYGQNKIGMRDQIKINKNDFNITNLYIFTLHEKGVSEDSKNNFKNHLIAKVGHDVEVIRYNKGKFEEELKSDTYINIRKAYFPSDILNANYLERNKKVLSNEDKEKIIKEIPNRDFGLSGNVNHDQITLADRKHNSFILNKSLYATTDSLKILNSLEEKIADDTFNNISDETKDKEKTYLEVLKLSAEKLNSKNKVMRNNEQTINILAPHEDTKHGLFINYGVEGKAEFYVKDKDNVLFNDKRDNV